MSGSRRWLPVPSRESLFRFVQQTAEDQQLDFKAVESRYAIHLAQREIVRLHGERFIFAFVRNPFERFYSCYRDKVLDPLETCARNILHNYGVELGMAFSDFVGLITAIEDRRIDRHLQSQSWFLNYEGLLTDYQGRNERFVQDWRSLAGRVGLPEPPARRSGNGPAPPSYRKAYTAKLACRTEECYREDLDRFGYRDEIADVLGGS